jgi:AcrR family transcriptional regulator
MLTLVNKARGEGILPAAMAVLRRDGPAGLVMRNVAAEAGVTATALYRHFDSKDALVKAVVKEAYRLFRQSLIADVTTGDAVVWLRVGFDRFLRFGLEHPNYYRLLFIEPHGHGIDRYPADFTKGKSAGFTHLRTIVERAIAEGSLSGTRSDAPAVALTIYAHMHGLITLHLGGRFPDVREFERFYFESIERILKGLGA